MADLLEQIRAALVDHGLEVEAAGPTGAQSVVVWLGNDERRRPRGLAVTPMDMPAEGPQAVRFVQLATELPFTVPADPTKLYRALAIVNDHVSLGSFGLDGQNRLYYRYVLPIAADEPVDAGLLAAVVDFASYVQEFYGDYVEGICTGDVSVHVLDEIIRQSGG